MIMQQINIIQLTPEQIKKLLSEVVKPEIENLKQSFQPKEPVTLLTRKEAAKLLKINLSTIWSWTNKGILKSYAIGNRIYYKRHEILQALTEIKNRK